MSPHMCNVRARNAMYYRSARAYEQLRAKGYPVQVGAHVTPEWAIAAVVCQSGAIVFVRRTSCVSPTTQESNWTSIQSLLCQGCSRGRSDERTRVLRPSSPSYMPAVAKPSNQRDRKCRIDKAGCQYGLKPTRSSHFFVTISRMPPKTRAKAVKVDEYVQLS